MNSKSGKSWLMMPVVMRRVISTYPISFPIMSFRQDVHHDRYVRWLKKFKPSEYEKISALVNQRDVNLPRR